MKKTFLSVLFLICIGFTGINYAGTESDSYKIIVDAGSSGSRIHVFKYHSTSGGIPEITEDGEKAISPGISSFASHPQDAGASLKDLLAYAQNQLASQNINPEHIPIDVLGTAGMRLVDAKTQTAIYDSIRHYISTQSPFSPEYIKTISGAEEGIFDWLDTNYLKQKFQHHEDPIGTLDLGGASSEITFVTNGTNKNDIIYNVAVGNQNYRIFSYSFLGLGQDEARKSVTQNPLGSSCYPTHLTVNSVQLGPFNYETCRNEIDQLLKEAKVSDITSEAASRPDLKFFGFSGFYYTLKFYQQLPTPDSASLETSIQSLCTKDWQAIKELYPDIPEKYLANYCFNGIYINELLKKGYQLPTYKNLTVTNKIDNIDIDWPLGALLYQLSQK